MHVIGAKAANCFGRDRGVQVGGGAIGTGRFPRVEEIVDDFGPRNANAVILPSWTVGAIVAVPGGAFPSYAHGYYKRNNAFYIAWDPIARERDTFLAWMKTNVLAGRPEDFAARARRPAAA